MNSNIFTRIELEFWNLTIRALSGSSAARSFLREAYQITHNSESVSFGILLGVTGVAGLVSGYLFYFVSAGIR